LGRRWRENPAFRVGVGDLARGRKSMSGQSPWTWDEMLAEFRALGGVAENVRQGQGARGRGLFPIDPSVDVRVCAPPHLLVDVDDVILDSRRLKIRPGAGTDRQIAAFFERYEADFSYGAGAAEDCRRTLTALHELPGAIQDYLLAGAPAGERRYPAATDDMVFKEYIRTRRIAVARSESPPSTSDAADDDDRDREKRMVLMPVVELTNHSSGHPGYDTTLGVMISGRFVDEVLVRYNNGDAWRLFQAYRFATPVPVAYSRGLDVRLPDGRIVRVTADYRETHMEDGLPLPRVALEGRVITASHIVLGNYLAPGQPRAVFRRLVRELGVADPDGLFDAIVHANRLWFLGLLEVLEGLDTPMIAEMRKAVRMQLQTVTFCVGAEAGPVRTSAGL
jgi:hypothetical protein